MSAKVTEAHRTKAHRIADAVTSYFDAQDDCEFETNLIEDIAQALADAEQAERERACAAIADYLDSRLSQSLADDLMAAIRARGTPAKEKADG